MKKLLLVIATLTTLSARSQTSVYHPFADSNAFWTMEESNCCWNLCSSWPVPDPIIIDYSFSYFVQGDTILNATNYHKLYKSAGIAHEHCALGGSINNWFNMNTEYAGGYRQDTVMKKVYFFYPNTLQECLLYDFSLNVGDTLYNGCLCFNCVVSGIDSVLIGNNYRKRFSFSGSNASIIEGIGSTFGWLVPLYPLDYLGTLICYSENGQTLYPDTTTQCYIIIAGVNEVNKPKSISISPNPFHTYATLNVSSEFINSELIIYNTIGNTVMQQTISSESIQISRNELSNGVYFYKIITDKGFPASGKIIIN
jgi:hypothetical protein